jgi:hypothetical protein
MTPGQIAYEAYRVYVEAHKSEMDNPNHPRYAGWLDNTPWATLDQVMRDAWEEAASAVTA